MNAWDIVTETLLAVQEKAQVGVKLSELDVFAEKIIRSHNAKPYNKGYKGDKDWKKAVRPKTPFPTTLVCCVNSVMAHGDATDYAIKDGDTVIFDLGVKYNGVCGDAAITVPVGNVSNKHERLVRYARQTVKEAIKHIKAGVSVAEVGRIIENYANLRGYVVVYTFAGHAIGEEMHEDPYIPNYWTNECENIFFEEGKMYCIEPILTYKDTWGMRLQGHEWAWITRDSTRCAMFEHQILVTKDGAKILTKGLF